MVDTIIISSLSVIILILTIVIFLLKKKNKQNISSYNTLLIEKEKLETDRQLNAEKESSMETFFSIITHDLRGPIGNFGSILQTMLENPGIYDEETTLDILNALKDTAKNTMDLLETLSQWSRLQRNKTTAHFEPFNVHSVVEMAIKKVQHKLDAKEIVITTNCLTTDFQLNSDITLVNTILIHLLTNAIKFSHQESEIILTVSKEKEGIKFHIEDNGVGINAEDFDKILDQNSFYFTYGTNNEKGPGLGITIIQNYCNLLGGKLWFESKKNEGSDFYVYLPSR